MDDRLFTSDPEVRQNDTLLEPFEMAYKPLLGYDLLAAAAAPPPMLVADLLRSKSLIAVSGEPYCGKTLFLLDLVLSLDSGAPFLNSFLPARNHRCLFIGQDAPTWDYIGGFSGLARGLGYAEMPPLTSVFILNRGLAFGQNNSTFINCVESAISLYGIDVLMLDTLKSFHDLDENSNQEMDRVMSLLKYLRDLHGLTVLFTHHTAKPTTSKDGRVEISGNYRARGASVIAGSIDQHVILTQSKGLISMTMAKARGSSGEIPASSFKIHSTRPNTLDLDADSGGNAIIASVLRTLRGSPTVQLRSINEALRNDVAFRHLTDAQLYSRVSTALLSLERAGAAHRTAHGTWARTTTTITETESQ